VALHKKSKGTNEQIKNNLIGAGNNTVKIQLSNGDTVCDFSYEAPIMIPSIVRNERILCESIPLNESLIFSIILSAPF